MYCTRQKFAWFMLIETIFFSPVWSSYIIMTNPIVIYYSYQNFMANLKQFIPI